MDEPGEWAEPWPYWKFGLKQNDLHESLHIKYNTIPSAIQDPEAFHHDVYELSTHANSLAEFECLMEERKTLRLKELDSMLEDASFQIVGCPNLIGTEQWSLAVQLFRTRSLDSLVRYFASYLPDEHPWHRDFDSCMNSTDSDAASPISYGDYDGPVLFDEPEDDEAFYTHASSESLSTCDTAVDVADQPARSNTMRSVDSGVSVTERKQRRSDWKSRSSSRTSSLLRAGSEHSITKLCDSIPSLRDDEVVSPIEDPDTPSTSVSDLPGAVDGAFSTAIVDGEDVDGYLSASHAQLSAVDTMDSDAPTPKAPTSFSPTTLAMPIFETKPSPLRTRSRSANSPHPHHAHFNHNHFNHQQTRNIATARQLRRRGDSLERERPKHVLGGRIGWGREASPDGAHSRARARRRRPGV